MRDVYLTFDVEDWIDDGVVPALDRILNLLCEFSFPGFFFITGDMAEKLSLHPDIVEKLTAHEIGFHTSSHSTRPMLTEYTDIPDYDEAVDVSIERDTSKIDYWSGEIRGVGGLNALKDLFPGKEITAYRGPGYSWSGPHMEALSRLGIEFDFTAQFGDTKVLHRGLTFHPEPIEYLENLTKKNIQDVVEKTKNADVSILSLHPNQYAVAGFWDTIFYKGNPEVLTQQTPLADTEAERRFSLLSDFLKELQILEETEVIEIQDKLKRAKEKISPDDLDLENVYDMSIWWPKEYFSYEPTHLRGHFLRYMGVQDG